MPEKQTVCLLNDSFPPMIDGVANAVVNYARIIERSYGHAIVATPALHGADDSAFPFPVLRYPSIDTRRLVGYVAGYPFSPELAGRLRQEHISILHTHCPVSSCLLARSLREVVDAPIVLTYHTKFDIDIAKALRGRLLQTGAIRALVQNAASCDEIWVVSRGAGENLRSLGYQGETVVMANGVDVPCGRVDEAQIEAETGAYDLPGEVPVFLFVGRMMWYKGLRIILDALYTLHMAAIPFRMVFVGDGRDNGEVKDYASMLGLDRECIFTGAIADREALRAWYARASLFLFPSTFDTNGLVVREAAASAVASVMVRGSCAAEGITDRENGFLIEENAASLSAALMQLCKEPVLMRQVGERAQKQLYLSWDSAVQHAVERYGIVSERYRAGEYRRSRTPMDELLNSQGELMKVLSGLDEKCEELLDTLRGDYRDRREDWENRRQELHDELQFGQDELREHIRTARRDVQVFWEKLDRYL